MKTAYARLLLTLLIIPFLLGTKARPTGYVDYCADANCVGCYRFNTKSGNSTIDESGTDGHPVNSGAEYLTSGCREGNCYDFDVGSEVLDTGYVTDHTVISVVGWIKIATFTAGSGSGRILDKETNIIVALSDVEYTGSGYGDDCFFLYAAFSSNKGQWYTANNTLTTGTWYHIAVTYDGSATGNNPLLYINGVSKAVNERSTPSGTKSTNASDYTIGNRDDVARDFDGIIDELAIFNDILTPAEIKDIYNNGLR